MTHQPCYPQLWHCILTTAVLLSSACHSTSNQGINVRGTSSGRSYATAIHIEQNKTMSGRIGGEAPPAMYYKFSSTKGTITIFEVEPNKLACRPRIHILGKAYELLEVLPIKEKDTLTTVRFQAPYNGDFAVQIKAKCESLNRAFSFRAIPAPKGKTVTVPPYQAPLSGLEFSLAIPIGMNTNIEGRVGGWSNDFMYYKFIATNGQFLQFDIRASGDNCGATFNLQNSKKQIIKEFKLEVGNTLNTSSFLAPYDDVFTLQVNSKCKKQNRSFAFSVKKN